MVVKKSLIKRVGERTGLKNEREILAYLNFSENADMDDGLIMFGNAKNAFWEEAAEKLKIKNYSESAKNKICKRYSEMGDNHFLNLFISKGLIHEPHFARLNSETKYPSLASYNYFNDPEIYTPFKRIGEKRWSGRYPNPITKEDIDYHKKFNYEFKI